ncbi:ABC transporter permease [Verrucomicrobium spinosum]|uniref:ABC transporter permease n=1 Tax=Verrucomicrobium spinosum TaxID=2736 RepID=UPI0012E22BEC|nr:FtsX-like permease family protein [Verrucomicrobium spinosum]
MGTDAEAPPFELVDGRWIRLADGAEAEGVLSLAAAEAAGVRVGDELVVGSGKRRQRLRVVGLVRSPDVSGWSASVAKTQTMTPAVGGVFVSTNLLERATGEARRISFIGVGLREGADLTRFRFQWSPRLSALATPCQFQEAHDIEEALDESASAENLEFQGHMAAVVAMLAAFFIILSTLNMGVTERIRQLAILRAVALTRMQTALLVVLEALLLGAVGYVVGCTSGWLLMKLAVARAPDLLEDGAVVGSFSLMLAAVCAFGGALLASFWPTWRAMRVRPLDVMGKLAEPPSGGSGPAGWHWDWSCSRCIPWWPACCRMGMRRLCCLPGGGAVLSGGGCRAVQPGARASGGSRPESAAGPRPGHPAAAAVESDFIELVPHPRHVCRPQRRARPAHRHSRLGAYHAGRVPSRSLGAGRDDRLPPGRHRSRRGRPDEFVERHHGSPAGGRGTTPAQGGSHPQCGARHRGAAGQRCHRGGGCQRAFGGSSPLFKFQWVQGHAEQAVALLRQGRGCIVPDHFLRESGLKLGDSFELVPPERPGQPVAYVIAATVKMPGWHWQTKPTGMRTRTHRAAALVFADYATVAQDFQFQAVPYVWLNWDLDQTRREAVEEAARRLLEISSGKPAVVGDPTAGSEQPYIKLHSIEDIRDIVNAHSRSGSGS